MRVKRLFLACSLAACAVAPVASPAAAQEDPCSDWPWVYVWLVPPPPAGPWVVNDNGTLTIRGDVVAGDAGALVDYYEANATRFVGCTLAQVARASSPVVDCIAAAAGPILSNPDPVSRYVEIDGLVVQVHYERALNDAIAIANCNGIVHYGG
jgi:hypothetical protein